MWRDSSLGKKNQLSFYRTPMLFKTHVVLYFTSDYTLYNLFIIYYVTNKETLNLENLHGLLSSLDHKINVEKFLGTLSHNKP